MHPFLVTSNGYFPHETVKKQKLPQTGFMNMTTRPLLFSNLPVQDLNSVEHLWDVLEWQIYSMKLLCDVVISGSTPYHKVLTRWIYLSFLFLYL